MSTVTIDHIAITVTDLSRSVDYYSRYFDFVEEKRFSKEGAEFVYLISGGLRLELWQFVQPVKPQDSLVNLKILGLRHIGFKVEDINSKRQELVDGGYEFSPVQQGSSGVYYSLGVDPDGIAIELISDSK